MATVIIPTPLRKFTDNNSRVTVQSGRVSDAVIELSKNYPNLKKYLVGTDGKITSFINIFVDNKDVRNLEQEHTKVQNNTIINIVPAIAGGIQSPDK